MTAVEEHPENPYFSRNQHRVLSTLAWLLFFLGLFAWFVQGANRPLDPGFAPAMVMLHLL